MKGKIFFPLLGDYTVSFSGAESLTKLALNKKAIRDLEGVGCRQGDQLDTTSSGTRGSIMAPHPFLNKISDALKGHPVMRNLQLLSKKALILAAYPNRKYF